MSDIVIRDLCKAFDDKQVLKNFNATFTEGKITCIMGDSGCGKTTLLNILLGFLEPDSGSIEGLPSRIGVVFQEDRLCEDFTAVSNIQMVTGKTRTKEQIEQILERMGLGAELYHPVRTFSGGMKRRVAIARALMYDCNLLVLDEAFKGLDGDTKANILACTEEYAAGRTVISVTHDPHEAEVFGDEIIRMEAR